MTFTLRLDDAHDAALERLAKRLGVSKGQAAGQAIMAADKNPSHPRLVRAATKRILERDAAILQRLAGS
jgi:predicted transcriptional regulator